MNDMDESYFDWSDDDDIICSSKYISSDEDDTLAIIRAHKKANLGKRKKSVFESQAKKQMVRKDEENEDEFEREMASELSEAMDYLTASFGLPGSSGTAQPTTRDHQEDGEFYDDIYFDSDESDAEEMDAVEPSRKGKQKRQSQHKKLTNDELFYDPTMDDKDQEWVNQKRRSYQPLARRPGRTVGVENNNTIQLPPSDAVLNCPACLTTLCLDCQRHEIYHNQYRAMFVFNCVVDVTEQLSYPNKNQKKRQFLKNKKGKKGIKQQEEEEEGKGTESKCEDASSSSLSSTSINIEGTGSKATVNSPAKPESSVSTSANELNTPSVKGEDTGATSSGSIGKGIEGHRPQPTANPNTSPSKPENAESPASFTEPRASSVKGTDAGFVSCGSLGKDMFHPVMCKICNTKVAVYDADEVYHFFNVVTSY